MESPLRCSCDGCYLVSQFDPDSDSQYSPADKELTPAKSPPATGELLSQVGTLRWNHRDVPRLPIQSLTGDVA